MYDFGMIGLGTMGCNLLLNMADNGFSVTGYDLDKVKVKTFEESANKGTVVKGFDTLEEMVRSLKLPRKIMMLVPAGKPVDAVIANLLPIISKGDIVIDGGNSHYVDTLKRIESLQSKGIHFMGMGISGGEKGARTGPSMMPGGDKEAYEYLKPILEAIAAKANGDPCVEYMGNGAAGHYVKMVHNGIEYAIMQIISEAYDLMKKGLGLNNDELHEVFASWNKQELRSFLIEITADIFLYKDEETGKDLIDLILDKAGAKGTGKWTSQDAMDLAVPIPTIDMAVAMREISVYKDQRVKASKFFAPEKKIEENREKFIALLHDALIAAITISYAQGLSLLSIASADLKMNIPLPEVVKIWRSGCIIRSTMLETFYSVYRQQPALQNILLHQDVSSLVKNKLQALRHVIVAAVQSSIPANALMTALGYIDAYSSASLPINLIQAQRDYFGAHTYQRTDEEGVFHSTWDVNAGVKAVQKEADPKK